MKKNGSVRTTIVCLICVLFLLAAVAGFMGSKHGRDESVDGKVEIAIQSPSDNELDIAYGSHFKTMGTLTGPIPDDAVLRVSLLDSSGNEIRFAQAEHKGSKHVSLDWYPGPVRYLEKGSDILEMTITAPELVVKDIDNPEQSAHDATIKAVFDDNQFAALITCATDVEHGLADEDYFNLTDQHGNAYDAIPKGSYTLKVQLSDSNGAVLSSAEKSITIGRNRGTVIHSLTTGNTFANGGKDILNQWAEENDFKILNDLLPGMFGMYQITAMAMSLEAEKAEYLGNSIHMLIYNIRDSSTSYRVEIPHCLQRTHNIDNPAIAHYYAFEFGEPRIQGKTSRIVELKNDTKLHLLRIDAVKPGAVDGMFPEDQSHIISSDTNALDGWQVDAEKDCAFMGVLIPYQLLDNEIIDNPADFGTVEYLNNVKSIRYTITDCCENPSDPCLGGSEHSETRNVGVLRVTGDKSNPDHTSVYEFYNIFPSGTFQSGHSYRIELQGIDRKGNSIPKMNASIVIHT